jgi:predicted ATP-grasp superfamily ATP-dependent carboligase
LEFAAHHRAWLEDNGYRPVEANDQIVLAMLDKGQTYDLARAIGIPVPRTAKVKTRVDLDAVADDFEYPCALKPRDSFRFSAIFARKAFVVHSRAELNEAFDLILPTGLEMLVTEIVRGLPSELYEFPSYYTYLDDGGEPLFHFTKRKLREQPLGWGTGTYHVTKWDPEVAELGLRFLQGVGLRGIGNVEFKRDARDGTLKLIECNPRPTATDKLLRHVGLDLGWIAYRRALGEPVERPGPFKDGVHQWTPSRDLVALREGRKLGTLTTASWLASLAHVQHFSIFDLGDPGPNIALTKQSATRIFSGKLTRRRA